jgi:hypothetical protein
MQTGTFETLSGKDEADETFVGGKARNMHKRNAKRRYKVAARRGRVASIHQLPRRGLLGNLESVVGR